MGNSGAFPAIRDLPHLICKTKFDLNLKQNCIMRIINIMTIIDIMHIITFSAWSLGIDSGTSSRWV
jgi:hypothetical protein